MKTLYTHDMKSETGELRLLFATQAYGMGADSPNVREIIHIGPPKDVESKYNHLQSPNILK